MKQALANEREEKTAPPKVVAERCVHAFSHQASCTACLDACPEGAWLLEDDGLGLNASACDGCGLCAPVCPEEAIQVEIKPKIRQLASQRVVFAICDRVPDVEGAGVLPCLHALGVREVARLFQQGVNHLITAHGDCFTCPRGEATHLEQSIQFLNLYLADRGFAPIELIELEASVWRRTLAISRETEVNGVSRRGLFSNARKTVVEADESVSSMPPTLGCLIAEGDRPDAVTPCSPVIAPDRCEGCDACVRLCPHGVFRIEDNAEDGDGAYDITPTHCTGCGLCIDVCEVNAVALERWSRTPQRRLQLDESACRACGVRIHMPKGRLPADDLCRICGRTNHHRNLFQVLD